MKNSVEKLDIYKRAYALSLQIHKASLEFAKIEQFALADQLRRSTKTICANLSEGFGKQDYSKPEFKRFMLMAIGSAHESRTWINYCHDLSYIEGSLYIIGLKNTQQLLICCVAYGQVFPI